MSSGYNMLSQDGDESSALHTTLPGTALMGPVTMNMTQSKSLIMKQGVPGCHPSRWIYELLNNKFATCDLFERARQAQLDTPFNWDHPHRLVFNGKQSFHTASSRTLSAICLDCHFHFVFKMSWEEQHTGDLCAEKTASGYWPLKDDQFPWHHLVWVGSEDEDVMQQERTKYYPLVARETFACFCAPCTFQIVLEISKPRFGKELLRLIQDEKEILRQLNIERERNPAKYEDAPDEWAKQGAINLNTYLKNMLEAAPDETRNISKRNKRFAVIFGARCFPIFRELELLEEEDVVDGVDGGVFTTVSIPPAAGPMDATELGTYRAYLEDVRAEIQCRIHKAGQAAERPSYCTSVLYTDLRCQEVAEADRHPLVNASQYKEMGVLPGQSRQIVDNAYKRQWDLVPTRRKELLESLANIAFDHGDHDFANYAMMQSSVFDAQVKSNNDNDDDDGDEASKARKYFGLRSSTSSSKQIIDAFRQKLSQDPDSADDARKELHKLAGASSDDSFQLALILEVDRKMTLETAKAVLGIESTPPWEELHKIYQSKAKANPSKNAKDLFIDAMDAIADHENNAELKGRALELRQENEFASSSKTDQLADMTLPVGLNNIGNTCYLNSLLQYLFTVKPVRDIVLNYEQVKLELDDEAIEKRRIGGNKMKMDRGEAVVAQAFVHELATLFRDLETSTMTASRPSQRLANAVLLTTSRLAHTPPKPSRAASPVPPPLPARPSPAPPSDLPDDVEMVNVFSDNVGNEAEEAHSNTSSLTLVEHEDLSVSREGEGIAIKEEDVTMQESQDQEAPVDIKEGSEVQVQSDTANVPAAVAIETIEVKEQSDTTSLPADAAIGTTEVHYDARSEAPAAQPETVDERVLRALEHQKRESGTDQQDVEEVMGSIISRLQAAIRPTTIEEDSGIQVEKIMETFFSTTVNYTKPFGHSQYQSETSYDRSITAYPALQGPCSLYEALSRNFYQQTMEESKLTRYTAIRTLPPVLHVLIQRTTTQNDKNENAVAIPETLYLDRFMDKPHDSPEFRRRAEEWTLASRIDELKQLLAQVKKANSNITSLDNYVAKTNTETLGLDLHAEEWEWDGPIEDDFVILSQPLATSAQTTTAGIPAPEHTTATQEAMDQKMEAELKTLEQRLETLHEGMKAHPYRLHAAICHQGHLMSGHYWVWIHDFQDNVWRRYNDSTVTVHSDTAEVLKILSTGGEPYYICYVRDDNKDDYVEVPKRQIPQTAQADEGGDAIIATVDPTEAATVPSSACSTIAGTPT
jgi:ubiquitin carboxyl-terminal hydrolase 25/28